MNASTNKVIKAIDLFAGIGGIRMGFEYAFNDNSESRISLNTAYVCELDDYARNTYAQNFSTPTCEDAWGCDIRSTEVKDAIPAFNICLAGFPCQAFSNAGKKEGFEDEKKRGTLFFDVAQICERHRPEVIFCENVRGLYTFGKKREDGYHEVYGIIRSCLVNMGYEVREKILNSADFGVPQNRERIYIVAFRRDVWDKAVASGVEFAFPTSNKYAEVSRHWAAFSMEDIREPGPIDSRYYISERYLTTLRRHREKNMANGHGFGYVVRDWQEKSGTILCSNMGRERNLVVDPNHGELVPPYSRMGPLNQEHIRRLTPREFMRLQGFPSDFKTVGIPESQLYKQFGNSVTVPVIESIAREIRLVLEAVDLSN